ncbi:putative centromere/kinetochore Zw10 [Lyophyllum shimeji]|uniref:Centromere/kinetochore Zw10 n=1 Tax=Lyophyllum shimeji TaxID=47721 RepID=A0A9P3UT02_LYOSH|nr:putative centromere/kinetochore Zw10 [Lyophyllum shimeji]
MAFPIPAHLPRRPNPQDVSSQILSKIDAATKQSLNATLAASWVSELEQTIKSTKERIHERIQSDLPEFQRQLAASKSVQERLQTLTTNVDALNDSICNEETGLIPTLVGSLTAHARLAQESTDTRVEIETLSHLLKCRTTLRSLENLVNEGRLPEAVEVCRHMETLLQDAPAHLDETEVMGDVKRRFRAAKARNEEQLSDAYTRGVIISHHEFIVHPSVQVRQSATVLTLESILVSLSPSSLSNHLTTLRRDLTNHFIDYISKQPAEALTTSNDPAEHSFALVPSPPNEEIPSARLVTLSAFFTFLSTHVCSCLPPSQASPFIGSLCKPTTTSLLNNLLIPSLPSSYEHLPSFLELLQRAVAFEDEIVVGLLGNDTNDRPVKAWADGVSGHYERQRRLLILDRSRDTIIASADRSDTFVVEVDAVPEPMPTVVAVQEDPISPVVPTQDEISPVKDDAWGFDDDVNATHESLAVDEDGWGFDEVMPDEPEPTPAPPAQLAEPSPSPEIMNGDDEPDPAEAWGWNDDNGDAPPAEETAWDDPWGDEPEPSASESPTDSRPPPAPSISSPPPKVATRLEKAANKGRKQHVNGTSSATPSVISSFEASPQRSSHPQPRTSKPSMPAQDILAEQSTKRPSNIKTGSTPKETYVVSGRTRRIISLVEDVLAEGKHLAGSSLFSSSALHSSSAATSSPLGSIILLSAPSVLDLYRGLYPVKFARELADAEQGMRFANDCAFLATEVERVRGALQRTTAAVVGERMDECERCFRVLSESWFHDVIEREKQAVNKILKEGAQGFTYTAEQDRYDECESAITEVLQQVRRLAQRLKGILPKSKYYTAIGMVADAALARILKDILALPDIPEIESHRLSELCRIFNAMEGLFVEDPTQPSFVVAYVPSWLKFSYLSELLEASMADITYLFEEGALVDFQVDELVRLVRALFADTQLRTNTISKLLGGHPVPAHLQE